MISPDRVAACSDSELRGRTLLISLSFSIRLPLRINELRLLSVINVKMNPNWYLVKVPKLVAPPF